MQLILAGQMSDPIFDAFEADLRVARVNSSGKFSRQVSSVFLLRARNQIMLTQSDVAPTIDAGTQICFGCASTAVALSTHMLQKFQAKRITASQTYVIFKDEDEAIAWLFEDEAHEHMRKLK